MCEPKPPIISQQKIGEFEKSGVKLQCSTEEREQLLAGGLKNIKGSRNQDSTVLYTQFESYMIHLKYFLTQLTNNNNNTTLFYYTSHTQQKLVSRWGVGKHITLQ